MASLSDLRYAFFGGEAGESTSDAEYGVLQEFYNAGISAADLLTQVQRSIGGTITGAVDDVVDMGEVQEETPASNYNIILEIAGDPVTIELPDPVTNGVLIVSVSSPDGMTALSACSSYTFTSPEADTVTSLGVVDDTLTSAIYVALPLSTEGFSLWGVYCIGLS